MGRGKHVLSGHFRFLTSFLVPLLACMGSVASLPLRLSENGTPAAPRHINLLEKGYVGGFERESIDSMLDAMLSDFDALVMGFVPNAASDPFLCSSTQEEHAVHMRLGVTLEVARIIFLDDQRGFLDAVTVPCTIV